MKRCFGFSMIDIIVAMAIVSTLLFIAVPVYQGNLRKNHRLDATLTMLSIEQKEELYRTRHPLFGSLQDVGSTTHTPKSYYQLSIENMTATGYTLKAEAVGEQKYDKEGQVACNPLRIIVEGVLVSRTPIVCW